MDDTTLRGSISKHEHEDKTEDQPDTPKNIADGFSKPREIAFIFTVCLAQMLQLAGLGQSIAPLHIIGDSFGITNPGQLSWTAAAYSLTVGTFILPAGRLGDIFGHKKMFMVGAAWYGLWNILAGVSVYSRFEFYAVCRGFEGMGASIMVPNALALIGRVYAIGDKKNMIFGLFGASAPIGWIFGVLFSAIFAQLAWWPWTYWTAGLVAFGAVCLASFSLPPDDIQPPSPAADAARPEETQDVHPTFDYLGACVGVSGLILFNFAWNQAAVVGWSTVYTYVLLLVGVILLCAFVYVEMQVSKDPLVPFRNLSKETALVLMILAAGWGSFGIWIYYIWQLIEVLRGYSPLSAVAQNAPVAVSGLLAAIATGSLISKLKVSTLLTAAMLCFLVGQILLATVPVGQIYWAQTFVSFIIMPIGLDMSFPTGSAILSQSMAHGDQGLAASLINTVVNYSISLCLGIAGTIESNVNKGGQDILLGYRGAWWFGIGLDALGLVTCIYFVWSSRG